MAPGCAGCIPHWLQAIPALPSCRFGGAMDLPWCSPPPGLIQSTVLLVPSTAGPAQPLLGLADLKATNQKTCLEPTSDPNRAELLGNCWSFVPL